MLKMCCLYLTLLYINHIKGCLTVDKLAKNLRNLQDVAKLSGSIFSASHKSINLELITFALVHPNLL